MTDLSIKIDGMSCASCVGRAERAIAALDGVREVAVNLATESAQVSLQSPATTDQIAQALQAAGYPARTETTDLAVEGMTCASCVGRVERALAAQPGVTQASVNLATETASLTYLAGSTTPQALAQAATAAGYPGKPRGADRPRGDDDKARELAELTRLSWIAALLTLPVFVIEMGGHFIPGVHALVERTIGMQTSWLLQFALTSLVLAWPGRRFFERGVPALLRGAPDMNSLVALGTAAAWSFSTVATFLPGLLPAGAVAVYFEAAAVIVTLILLGRLLEARAKGRTGQAITKLLNLQAKTARVKRDGGMQTLPIDQIVVDDIIQIRPGEMVPTDGVVVRGATYVDQSMVSGEPVPVPRGEGDPVIGGTLNETGAIDMRATKVGRDTMLSQIIAMVERAQGAKLPIQALVDRVTGWFVPVVLVLAALTVAVWLAVGPDPALGAALVAGVAVLIVACPCAMGLATPTSIMVGTGRAAQMGVLFRKGDALQALQGARIVAFDKTGTLTAGRPELTKFQVAEGLDEDTVLALVAAVEDHSEHPIARAVVRAAQTRGLTLSEPTNFSTLTGMGVEAQVGGRAVLVGADRLMQKRGIEIGPLADVGRRLGEAGQTPLYAAVDGRIAAVIGVSDPIKDSTPAAIAALHEMGLKVAMITGDNEATARVIAAQLGIDHVVAEVLPDGKVDAIEALRRDGGKIAYVGDGINDAPALAAADVGVAIGTGTDVAIESADVVLMSGDIRGVVNAIHLSHRVMRNIAQNLFWAFAYNAALIPVAAGVLYPLNGMLLSPMLAAGAMALSSVFVLTNALRLQWVAPPMTEAKPGPARLAAVTAK